MNTDNAITAIKAGFTERTDDCQCAFCQAARFLVKRCEELEYNLAWIRRKLGLPPDADMFSGDHTIAGMLHVWDSRQHGYQTYIEVHKCEDKQGEIARQAKRIMELETIARNAKHVLERIKHIDQTNHNCRACQLYADIAAAEIAKEQP
jgi:hypothetical protein